ncbi:hypothetical protein [Flammeovirga kamogawensis]|uniref:hypothetical protein n=1 Tax=Flammeovirga kamogawensis TaxID=373891 RepID=UPI0011826E05|nr:hypothetical protein [Flammeovirga kamogawensis]TRX64795.1 hypothetical protein EO216_19865 [Flammeovirga kamogawensis]
MKQIVLIFLCVLSLQTTGQTDLSAFQPYNTQGDNIIHVTTADFDAVGAKDYVVTMTVDGKVIAFNRPSEIATPSADNRLWEYTNLPSIGIRILAEDLIPDSLGDEILLPGTDGHIRILSSAGTLLIDKKISSGVLYSTAVGKNNKGETMLIVSGVDGLIHFLDTSGDLITTVRPKTDRTGKIAGLIRHLIVGDFDGDGGDEVAAFINRKSFEGNNFMDIIDLSTFKRPNYWNGETGEISDNTTPGLGFTDKQLGYSYDMDNDGDEEIVAHWGVYHPEDGVGTKTFSTMIKEEEKLTLQKYEGFAQQYLIDNHGFKQKDKEKLTNTGKYLMQYGLPGDFNNDGKAELFTLYGDDLFLSKYTAETQELAISEYTWAHSEYHFPGIARLEDRNGGGDKVVLAGPINGDDHFYIVDVAKPDWRIQARKINGKGVLGDVAQNIDQLTIDIDGTTTNDEIGDDKILYVGSSFNGWLGWEMTEENCQIKAQNTYDAMQEWYTKIGGSSRVRLVSSLNTTIYGETSQDENAKITKEGVIAYAKALAKKGVYFNVIIGHGNHLYMTPETFAAIYEASIIDGECYMSARTKEIRTKEYFDYYIPLLDAVIEKSEQLGTPPPMVMICAKGPVITALTQEQGDNYFPKYKDVLVPGVENSNVGTQGLSIQERVGLWMNGDVKNWGCNVIGDNLTPNRVTEYGGMRNPHVVLRHLLSQYSLGAKIFRITSVTNLGNPMYQRGDVTGEEQVWSGVYEKGVLNFLKIVEKGIYPHATKPSEVKGISPVAISLYNRSDRMLENSINHDHEFYTPVLNEYVLNKMACWDAYTDVPENDVTFFTGGQNVDSIIYCLFRKEDLLHLFHMRQQKK